MVLIMYMHYGTSGMYDNNGAYVTGGEHGTSIVTVLGSNGVYGANNSYGTIVMMQCGLSILISFL